MRWNSPIGQEWSQVKCGIRRPCNDTNVGPVYTSSPFTVLHKRGVWVQYTRPSMGPPPFGDGNCHGSRYMDAREIPFNGATAFRRWKLEGAMGVWWEEAHLQWGHRLSAMETRRK